MGALPSGGDDSQFDLGLFGIVGAGFTDLATRTQDNIEQMQRDQMGNSPGWLGASDLIFEGLDATLGLPLAILKGIVSKLFPGLSIPGSVSELLDVLDDIPVIGGLIDIIFNGVQGITGSTGNPLSALLSPILGLFSTATTANTNASTSLGNWSSLLAGLPGVSTISGLLSFLIPGTGSNGIFAPLINGILGGTTNPLSSLLSNLLGTASTASTANTNANTGLSNWSSLLAGLPGVSTISGLLSFLIPSTGSNGIFAPLINGILGGTTNPLSSLLSNLLGTASTASTASTNASTGLSNWSSLLSGLPGLSTITDLIGWLYPTTSSQGIFARLINGVAGGTTNPLSSLISSLLGTASTASTASTNSTTNSTNIVTFLTNMFNGITRQGASTATQDDTYGAVQSQADTVVGTAATMEQIIAALGSGTPDADDFERASLGANWSTYSTGTGSLSIPNSHDAKWSGTGSSSEFVTIKNNVVSAGDHQTSTIVLATAFPSYPFFTPFPYGGYVDLWVRCTNFSTYATRTGLRFRINGNPPYAASWSLDWISSGTATNLGSGSMSIPGAGASIAFEAGVGGNNRRFQARLNGTIISGADITEGGTTSQFGASYRYRGWGGKGNSGVGTNQGVPSIKQWTAQG